MVSLSLQYLVSIACPQAVVIFLWGDHMNQHFDQTYIMVAFKVLPMK
jgi:hypothetical protein